MENRNKFIILKNKLVHDKKGAGGAVELLVSASALILLFATFVMSLVYITQYYSCCHLCRQIVAEIEREGQYRTSIQTDYLTGFGNEYLDALTNNSTQGITVTDGSGTRIAPGTTSNNTGKIDWREEFTVTLSTNYRIPLSALGGDASFKVPINISIKGRSGKYWK